MKSLFKLLIVLIIFSSCSNDEEECRCREFLDTVQGTTFVAFSCFDDIRFIGPNDFEEAVERCK